MRLLIQIKAVFVAFYLVFLVLVPTCLFALPFALRRRLKIVCPVWQYASRTILRSACHSHIDVMEDYRSESFRTVPTYGLYVANHQSYMDIPLIMSMVQIPPIMKKEVLYIPLIGLLAWSSGSLPVSRGKYSSRKKVFEKTRKRLINDKIAIQVYPEATRSKDALPKKFEDVKSALMKFAYEENIPVVPTSLYGSRGILSRLGLINPNRHVGVMIHKEINPSDFSTSEEFCKACWQKVVEGHDQIKSRLGPLNESLS